jgi:hypothetical protein
MCTHFNFTNIFYTKYFHKSFSYFQNNSMDKKDTSLVSFLSMKLWEYYPRLIKDIVAILFLHHHLAINNLSLQHHKHLSPIYLIM